MRALDEEQLVRWRNRWRTAQRQCAVLQRKFEAGFRYTNFLLASDPPRRKPVLLHVGTRGDRHKKRRKKMARQWPNRPQVPFSYKECNTKTTCGWDTDKCAGVNAAVCNTHSPIREFGWGYAKCISTPVLSEDCGGMVRVSRSASVIERAHIWPSASFLGTCVSLRCPHRWAGSEG